MEFNSFWLYYSRRTGAERTLSYWESVKLFVVGLLISTVIVAAFGALYWALAG